MKDFFIGARCDHKVNTIIYPITTCPLCNGLGYRWINRENDLQLDYQRKPIILEGTMKLKQEVVKILLTRLGSDLVDANYGTDLYKIVGLKQTTRIPTLIKTQILQALAHYTLINQNNTNPDEIIASIDSLKIERSITDPRLISISIILITTGGKTVPLSVNLGA